ncbi:MAG: patatin-like phospholipase family protein [Acidimicrobiales bacterium]
MAAASSRSGGLPPIRDVLLDRLAENSSPGARTDGHHVVLAVEGGGMRGAVSSGMLLALEQLGLRDSFDEVVGTSAGAISGAFFVIGEGTKGSVLYYTVLNSERFVDRRRLVRGESVLDLDYLIGDAFDHHGFDWPALLSSDIPLWATLSPATPSDETRLVRVGDSVDQARRVLLATTNLPVLAGGNRFVNDRPYVDGGLLEAVPWASAVGRGATHVFVARSRGFVEGGKPEPRNLFERTAVPRMVRRMHGDHVAELVDEGPQRFFDNTEALRSVADGDSSSISAHGRDIVVEVVMPAPDAALPDRLAVDTHELMDGLAAGAEAMVDHLDLEGFEVEQRVVVNHPRAPVGHVRRSALVPVVTERRRAMRGLD